MGDIYIANPELLHGQPKRTIADYVEQNGILVPRRFDTLSDARRSHKGIFLRSEHEQEYNGVSGLLDSFELSRRMVDGDRKNPIIFSPRGIQDLEEIKKDYFQYLKDSRSEHPLDQFYRFTNTTKQDLINNTSFSIWEYLDGIKRTIVADSAIPNKYHITTNRFGDNWIHNRTIFEKGKKPNQYLNKLTPELEEGLEEFIETYEEIRHLKNFDPNHCPIMEFMTIGNKNYFLQYHKTRDFEPSTFVLDRPRKKGEKPTWFVRGATSPEGMTVKTTIQYSALWTELSNIPNPQDEEGSFDFHYKNVFSDIMSRRRKLQIEVERHNLKSAFIKGIDRGHLPAAKLFKPEVSIIMNERYRSYQRSEVKNWSNNLKNKFPHHSGKDEILNQPNFTIDLHVISDGRKAYISRV